MGTKVNPNEVIFSLDIGTRSVIGTVGVLKGKKFQVVYESYIEHEERAMIDGQIHDISLVANAVNTVKKQLEKKLKFKLERVAIAAAGRFLRTTVVKSELRIEEDKEIDRELIRSLELTAVKKAEDEVNRDTQGKLYCVGYSVKSYYLNGFIINNLLSHKGENAGVEIIATFLPRSVVDSLYAVMGRVGLEVASLTLEPIAAIEAAIPQNLRLLNLALVDIGAGTSDIAISSKDSIVAYGMVPIAGDEVTEAIAQYYLVDFNTAERIKRECENCEIVTYKDVLGMENQITREEIFNVITPTVKKACEEIGEKIIELNSGKAPNAVFLVGGGAHTPLLLDYLAERLNLPKQRVAIKDRDSLEDCICSNKLGSTGVTVLGIALVFIKRMGQDFIDVILNGNVVSLFNCNKHTVLDVMVQAGINAKVLIGRNGKNIRFTVNGIKRLAFGSMAENAEIKVNGTAASIDTPVKEGDIIEMKYAKDGRDASPKILEYAVNYDAVSFYFNEKVYNMEPVAVVNNEKVGFDHSIKENDDVEVVYPSTLGDFIKYSLSRVSPDSKFYNGDLEISYDYIIKEGDNIIEKDIVNIVSNAAVSSEKSISAEEGSKSPELAGGQEIGKDAGSQKLDDDVKEITIKVNSQEVIMKGKNKYIFIDVFNYIQFDRTRVKGTLILKLNGNHAGYNDELKDKDVVEIYWQ